MTDSIALTESLKVLWDRTAGSADARFWGVLNRFTADAIKGPFTVGLRYDVDAAFEKDKTWAKERPRKFTFEYAQRNVDLILGDHYASFGRGIVLNVVKNDEFGLDTTIQGEKLSVDTDYVSFRGLAGSVNPGDPIRFTPAQVKAPDPALSDRDLLWGGEAVLSWPGVVSAGARYVGAVIRTDLTTEPAEYEQDNSQNNFGVSLEFPNLFGVGAFYAEYAWLELEDRKKGGLQDVRQEGRAAYFSASFYGHGVDFLLEGKDYYRATFVYAEGPSLEYQKVVFELPHYEDELGLHGRIGYRIPVADLYVHLDYLDAKTHKTLPKDLAGHYDEGKKYGWITGVRHLYGGFERDFANSARIEATAGYRGEATDRWIHAEFFASAPILPQHSVAATVMWRQYQGLAIYEGTTYGSQLFSVTYAWSPLLTVTGTYEHSNEPFAGSTGDSVVSGGGGKRENFPAVEVTVRPMETLAVTAFWGATKGGLQCSGGICRQVPAFDGLRVEVAAQF